MVSIHDTGGEAVTTFSPAGPVFAPAAPLPVGASGKFYAGAAYRYLTSEQMSIFSPLRDIV